ncbi:hypothetical protein TWF281_009903 [Arthrobotrys megalospora]
MARDEQRGNLVVSPMNGVCLCSLRVIRASNKISETGKLQGLQERFARLDLASADSMRMPGGDGVVLVLPPGIIRKMKQKKKKRKRRSRKKMDWRLPDILM